jgi:hypothetical protein
VASPLRIPKVPFHYKLWPRIFMVFFISYMKMPENYIILVDDAYTFSTSL